MESIKGLSQNEVINARAQYGSNELVYKKKNSFLAALTGLFKEPMVLLLLIASSIYFISGAYSDAIFLFVSIILVAAISIFQDNRSQKALEKLKQLSSAHCKVIREGTQQEILSSELVIGDIIVVEEGTMIMADAEILQANDFSVNESSLTGESFSVFKYADTNQNIIYKGTIVTSGLALAKITAIGNETEIGRIGKSIENIGDEKTPLEKQIHQFVKTMVLWGVLIFLLVWGINYVQSKNLADSLLKALTLAMSILPEEIPVAFSTFMALGAWRLMQMGVIVKQMKTVETLGSATVICTDKTGTLTENQMNLAFLYHLEKEKIFEQHEIHTEADCRLLSMAMWSSEPIPFDGMEKAIHQAYTQFVKEDERKNFQMIHEYPLDGQPPMMTHIFENKSGKRIIAAKGAPEAITACCNLSVETIKIINHQAEQLASKGYRLLAVAQSNYEGANFFEQQQQYNFEFCGLLAFFDPPKKNIKSVLQNFYNAGIDVKIITGDNVLTTKAIAEQIDFKGADKTISGNELMAMDELQLKTAVKEYNIFARMFPEAKLRIINALKANQEIVAMTGDGINDGPALKAAHIGIAMGKKGTEIAKQASSLILADDDLSRMMDAVKMGRKIYTNLKKAIRYIISIHIPIILTVFIPLALGWMYPNIFTPVHVIFLELIMGPTCSIIYENEPPENNTMQQAPRPFSENFFSLKEIGLSVVQGLAITLACLLVYQLSIQFQFSENHTRAMVFSTLIFANITLTLVNRSFYYSLLQSLKNRNKLVPLIIFITLVLGAILIYQPVIAEFFKFSPLNIQQLFYCFGFGSTSVLWYELVKWRKRLVSCKKH